MKKTTFFSTIFLLFLVFQVKAQILEYTCRFEKPQIKGTSDGYTDIRYQDCANLGEEGNPLLPQHAVSVLLPPGTEISSYDIIKVEYYPEESGIHIRPASRQFPISKGVPDGYKTVGNPTIYSNKTAYPATAVNAVSTGFLCGHALGSFNICPVVYYPSLHKVKFIKSITIEIHNQATAKASKALNMLRADNRINKKIQLLTQQNEYLPSYDAMAKRNNSTYDILLITNNVLLPYFNEYVKFKKSTGYAVVCKTTEDIYNQYSGDDSQMKIRNCIIDQYQNSGISYVILAGDADANSSTDNIIPSRGFFANPGDAVYSDYNIPSDMYYACLDGNWNTDNDDKWAEADEADLYYEVGIGRLCVDSPEEIQNVVNKLILYQTSPVTADIKKALMVGEKLDVSTYGDTYKDEVANGGTYNGYTTIGIPSSFTVDRLYASEGGWNKTDIFSAFNSGTHLLNHLGHSDVTYNMQMYTSDLTTTNFQNNGINHELVITYSQGCYNGAFDNRNSTLQYVADSYAEEFTTLSTGTVASIANSRYGWYVQSGTNGGSQFFDRQFFDAIFNENIFTIGDINSDSKEDNVTYINTGEGVVRWCAYETNLFGDPTMDIWTDVPANITVTYPDSIATGVSQIYFQTDTPFARIGLMQGDFLIGKGITDASGNLLITFENPITNADTISVSITGHNRNRHLGNILVIPNQPYIVYQSYQINDASGNNNGLLDDGETIKLQMSLQNLGTQPASNVNAILRTSNPYITITDSTENYGEFAANQVKSINDAFIFTVADSIPDQHTVHFQLHAEDNLSWNSYFDIVTNAPILAMGNLIINDSVNGNSNNRLDPGETAVIKIISENNGHADCKNVNGTLVSSSPFITIDQPVYFIENLIAGENTQVQFTIHIDPAATVGNYSTLGYTLTNGIYQASKEYRVKTGNYEENWETGNFSQFNWQQGGNAPWTIVNNGAYEGNWSAVSGDVSNNQSSVLTIDVNVTDYDTIRFFRKVSSEEYDYLKFYIDNVLQDKWSGETDWGKASFAVTPGVHTFKWSYEKDFYGTNGSDCAWIDLIELPAPVITTAFAGHDATVCGSDVFTCNGRASNYASINWTTSGTGAFSNPSVLNPVYTPSEADLAVGQVTLTLHAVATAPLTDTSDNMILTLSDLPETPAMPQGPEYVDLTHVSFSTYTIEPVNNADSYTWILSPSDAGTFFSSDAEVQITWNQGFLGNVSLSAKAVNDCGESNTSGLKNILVDRTNSINENSAYALHIYPNPNDGKFTINLNAVAKDKLSVRIVNIYDVEIYSENLTTNGIVNHELQLNTIKSGVYLLLIEGKQGNAISRFIVK